MLLHLDRSSAGVVLAVDVTRFATPWAASAWRRSARRALPSVPGLVFAQALPYMASGGGFGLGPPDPRRQILLSAWRDARDYERFVTHPLAERLMAACTWSVLTDIVSSRGTHLGTNPLRSGATNQGRFAALTLGRCRPRAFPRFLREGARLGPYLRHAPGLITACSAGVPLTANCTFSIWTTEDAMLAFAYRRSNGHIRAAHAEPRIMMEQLRARLVSAVSRARRRRAPRWREKRSSKHAGLGASPSPLPQVHSRRSSETTNPPTHRLLPLHACTTSRIRPRLPLFVAVGALCLWTDAFRDHAGLGRVVGWM